MTLKEKLTSMLFRPKSGEADSAELPQDQSFAAETQPELTLEDLANPAVLELSSDHPIQRLCQLRRREGGQVSTPRICMDDEGVLPEEVVQREKNRLSKVLTGICAARLKQAKGVNKQEKHKKKAEAEKDEEPLALDALPRFFISADKLYAWVLVFPPAGKGEELTREMLYTALLDQGITYGLDSHLADRLAHDEQRYLNLFLIARGTPAFDGTNGNIVDRFPRESVKVLEVDEFDRVDYTALNLIHNVNEGEEICRLIKPTEGAPGRTVLDQEIPAKSGKTVPLPRGKNTDISEDGCLLVASIAGDVEFNGRTFQVKPVLDIAGNVDFSTGNINFLGDVNIRGDVLSGFTVQAMGNIQVAGVVEAGSTVEAGGDLAVVKGILGDGTTIVRSQRSIFSKYVENATIFVRENLQTDCIVNSKIYSDGEVIVRSGRGAIIGGRVWAAKKISAMSVGARSECRTSVALGGRPCASLECEVARQKLRRLELELEKLELQPESASRSSLMEKNQARQKAAQLKVKQLEADLASIKPEPEGRSKGRLECNIAYAGAEVSFGAEVLRLRQEHRQCIATLVCGEIVLT